MKNVGNNLKILREEKKLTQEYVGNKLGIGRDAVIRIEKGIRNISISELNNFSKIYGIKVSDIIEGNLAIKKDNVKGIILAGGTGSRLYPITKGTSKQLIPVYDKPMIYYPLSILMQANIKDILIITTKEDNKSFKNLLGDGSLFGINISYKVQLSPNGLAEAFIIGEKFIGNNACAMILGDNIFYGSELEDKLMKARMNAYNGVATIFGYQVKDPTRFGIMELDKDNNILSVEEKPKNPKSDYAITGLYFYPSGVSKLAKEIKPSERNELEITSLNDIYLKDNSLKGILLNDGYTWFDTGTFDSLLDASNMIKSIETNRETLICSPELIAYKNNWIDKEQLKNLALNQNKNSYGKTLVKVLERN